MSHETHERYGPGGAEAELRTFAGYARRIIRIQERNRHGGAAARAFHAKPVLGVGNATLSVYDDLPQDLRHDCFQPSAVLPATVRLSNAAGAHQPDGAKDMRGIAVRIWAPRNAHAHDLLATNHERSPAADAAEFMAMAAALAGRTSAAGKLASLIVRLPPQVGVRATARIVGNLFASGRTVGSLATQTYWSRGAVLWGPAGPVRYLLRPVGPAASPPPSTSRRTGPVPDDALRVDLQQRLRTADLEFELAVQRYVSDADTPVEDTSKAWRGTPVPVGRLVIPRQDLDTAQARAVEREVDRLAFNPWNTPDDFRPLGNLNRARRAVYEASAAHRAGQRFEADVRPVQAVADAVADRAFGLLGRRVPWYRLPTRLSLLNLSVLRRRLRRDNLVDIDPRPSRVEVRQPAPPPTAAQRLQRDPEGRYNDLSAPQMGSVGRPFGRNMAVRRNRSDLPHPRDVSDLLLARERFLPASSLNVLAAAWIQFQVHDWANHRRHPVGVRSVTIPARPGRDEAVMRIGADDGPGNDVTHWWDGSEVYGTPARPGKPDSTARRVGTTADLELDGDGCLPLDPATGLPRTDFGDAWWLGLSLLQTLMTREHNAICAALRREHPELSEDRIFHVARLVVAALIAKIHTVEWTPAVLGRRSVEIGMNVLWSGAPADRLTAAGIRLLEPGQLHGTVGSLPDHHGVPFSLTEEFVTVYRMHQLIPDDFVFVDHSTGRVSENLSLPDLLGGKGEQVLRNHGLTDVVHSFATANPGAITLHNFPAHLRAFTVNGGEPIDLAAVDVVRTRARGVPRYNDFRAALHMPRLRRFEQVTTDPRSLARLQRLYGLVDDIDTVVGLLAEEPPPGFGFSDTAFRLFLLMASRRLQSDRFLTVDFRPEVYTRLGMDWIARNGFADVLLRHCPELAPVVGRGKAVFAPWR